MGAAPHDCLLWASSGFTLRRRARLQPYGTQLDRAQGGPEARKDLLDSSTDAKYTTIGPAGGTQESRTG